MFREPGRRRDVKGWKMDHWLFILATHTPYDQGRMIANANWQWLFLKNWSWSWSHVPMRCDQFCNHFLVAGTHSAAVELETYCHTFSPLYFGWRQRLNKLYSFEKWGLISIFILSYSTSVLGPNYCNTSGLYRQKSLLNYLQRKTGSQNWTWSWYSKWSR